MSAIEISCPHCGAKALVSQDDLGHDIDCPKCEESFEAPQMAKRSRVVGNGQSEDAEPEDGNFDDWIAALRNRYGADDETNLNREVSYDDSATDDRLYASLEKEYYEAAIEPGKGLEAAADTYPIELRVKELSSYLGGDDAVKSAVELLKKYISDTEGEIPRGRDLLESALTLKDDPDFYSVTESVWRKSRGTVHLLWRGREVVKVDFDCEYENHGIQFNPPRDWREYEEDYDAYSDEDFRPDDTGAYEWRVRKNGKATLVADSTSKRPVEGLEDVLRKQKARGPKKDRWADFEEPTKGRKMTCWRCGYQGKTADSEWDLGGFREVKCPRCAAKGTVPLRLTTRVSYYLGAIVFLLLAITTLINGIFMLTRNMTFGGLALGLGYLMLGYSCVKVLAKDSSIRSAKKK